MKRRTILKSIAALIPAGVVGKAVADVGGGSGSRWQDLPHYAYRFEVSQEEEARGQRLPSLPIHSFMDPTRIEVQVDGVSARFWVDGPSFSKRLKVPKRAGSMIIRIAPNPDFNVLA